MAISTAIMIVSAVVWLYAVSNAGPATVARKTSEMAKRFMTAAVSM